MSGGEGTVSGSAEGLRVHELALETAHQTTKSVSWGCCCAQWASSWARGPGSEDQPTCEQWLEDEVLGLSFFVVKTPVHKAAARWKLLQAALPWGVGYGRPLRTSRQSETQTISGSNEIGRRSKITACFTSSGLVGAGAWLPPASSRALLHVRGEEAGAVDGLGGCPTFAFNSVFDLGSRLPHTAQAGPWPRATWPGSQGQQQQEAGVARPPRPQQPPLLAGIFLPASRSHGA